MWAQMPFYTNNKKHLTFTKTNIFDGHAKVCIEVTTIDWSQHPHTNSQDNKNMITSHFDIFLHILIIYKMHSSCVYT